jgi:hypothetical protein
MTMTKEELDLCFHRAHQEVEDFAVKAAIPWEDGKKVEVTTEQAAAFLRWQALQLNGEWDAEALKDARWCLCTKTELIKGGPGWVLVWDGGVQGAVR